MSEKKGVVVTSTIELDDKTYEKILEAVCEQMEKMWVPIECDDDLPDEEGYYLVTAEDEFKDRVLKVAWFTLQNPMVYRSPKGFWSNENGKWKNVAWKTIPPAYEGEVEDD